MGYGFERNDLKVIRFTNLPVEANEDLISELCIQFGDIESIQWGRPVSDDNYAAQQQKSLRNGETTNNLLGKALGEAAMGGAGKADFCLVEYTHAVDAAYAFRILSHSRIRLFGQDIKISSRAYDFKSASTEGKKLQEALFGKKSREGHLLRDSIRHYEEQYLSSGGGDGSGVDALLVGSAAAISAEEMATLGGSTTMDDIGAKLLVENLDKKLTTQELTTFFQQFGPFAAPVKLITDQDGFSKGKCIVSYKDFDTSDSVLDQTEGMVFSNRVLKIQYAQLEDGSGRRHGSPEERANAKKFQAADARRSKAIEDAKASVTKKARVEMTIGRGGGGGTGTAGTTSTVPSWAPTQTRQQQPSVAPSSGHNAGVYGRI